MAQSCVCVGLPALLSNLIRTYTEHTPDEYLRTPWLREYCA